ncbi:hypothetical protein HPB47_015887 [Ixodes persulcatus]|uniref:Uncharacterized protein n=1 Tax=Ixodes persulcatus TaxID=34615 RepID=A0AC60QT79_IXOPE|nr:hypothetical protein HPB47_015887 [Ixodes persulcatus]
MKFPHFRRKRALAFVVLAGALLLTLNYVLKSEDASGCGRTAETPQCLSSLFPKVVRKVGWKNRLIPPTACHTLHCFPAELIAVPMNVVPFLGTKVAVPHEGIEVLKYMFPDTWWKEIIPPNCK